MSDKASELFWDVFMGGGARSIDCACGRQHFTRKPDDWESEEELALIMNRECAMPDRVIGTDDDSVGYACVNGVVLCYGCPCNSAFKYESFLVEEQSTILKFYRKRAERQREKLSKDELGLAALGAGAS